MAYDEDGHKKFGACLNGEKSTILEENEIKPNVTDGLDLDSSLDNDILQSNQEWIQDLEVDWNFGADGDLCVKERKKYQTAPAEHRVESALTQVSDDKLDFSVEVDQDVRYGVASAVIRTLHDGIERFGAASGWSSRGETNESSSESEGGHWNACKEQSR